MSRKLAAWILAGAVAVGSGGRVHAGAPVVSRDPYVGALVIDAASGDVLFADQPDARGYPASMLKLMTVEVVFNALKEGKVKLTDEYRISENAWRKGGAPAGVSSSLRPCLKLLMPLAKSPMIPEILPRPPKISRTTTRKMIISTGPIRPMVSTPFAAGAA